MTRLAIMLALCSGLLCAQELEFKPIKCTPTGSNLSPSSWQVTWDKPALPEGVVIKQLEVFCFAQSWPVAPSIDERCPKWREFLFADNFDAAAFNKANGPETMRFRIDVDVERAPLGVIGRLDEPRMVNVHVLFIDADGKRHLPVNMVASVEEAHHVRKDVYYMPDYFPYFTTNRLFSKEAGFKLAWELPELGGGPYEIEKLLFIGMEKSLPSMWVARMDNKLADWFAGKDADSKPMLQELAADAKGCWVKDLNFSNYIVLARTKGGLHFYVKPALQGSRYEAPATDEDKKALTAIELKKPE